MKRLPCKALISFVFGLLLAGCGGGGDGSVSDGTTTTQSMGASSTTLSSIVLNPSSATVADCSANVPFIFSGGTPPYTVSSADGTKVRVSSAQPLGQKFYFVASVGPLGSADTPPVLLTVTDSQQQAATATVSFSSTQLNCPNDPLLQITATTSTVRLGEIVRFNVNACSCDYVASSSDDMIAAVVAQNDYSFDVQANSGGTVLITLKSNVDGQMANLVFTVPPVQQ